MTMFLWILIGLLIMIVLAMLGAIFVYMQIKNNSQKREKNMEVLRTKFSEAKLEHIDKMLNYVYLAAKANNEFVPIYSALDVKCKSIDASFKSCKEEFMTFGLMVKKMSYRKFKKKFLEIERKIDVWIGIADQLISELHDTTKENQMLRTELSYFDTAFRKMKNIFNGKRTSFGEAENIVAKRIKVVNEYLKNTRERIIKNTLSEKDVNVNAIKDEIIKVGKIIDRTPDYVAHIFSSIKDRALMIQKQYNKQINDSEKTDTSQTDKEYYNSLISNFTKEYKSAKNALKKLDIELIETSIKKCYLILINLQDSINMENKSKIAFLKIYEMVRRSYKKIESTFSKIHNTFENDSNFKEEHGDKVYELKENIGRLSMLFVSLERFTANKKVTFYHKWIKLKAFVSDVYKFSVELNELNKEAFDIINRSKIMMNEVKLVKDAVFKTMSDAIDLDIEIDKKTKEQYVSISSDVDAFETHLLNEGNDQDDDKLVALQSRVVDFCKKVGYSSATYVLATKLLEFASARLSSNEGLKIATLQSEKMLAAGNYKDAILLIVNEMEVQR